jgi:hypothetical protein
VSAGRWKNHAQRTEIVLFLAGLLAVERTTWLLHDDAHSAVLVVAIKTLFLYADWSLLYSCSFYCTPAVLTILLLFLLYSCSSYCTPAVLTVLLLFLLYSCCSYCTPAVLTVLLLFLLYSCSSYCTPALLTVLLLFFLYSCCLTVLRIDVTKHPKSVIKIVSRLFTVVDLSEGYQGFLQWLICLKYIKAFYSG